MTRRFFTDVALSGELSWEVRGDTNANGLITALETNNISSMYFSGSSPTLGGLVNPDSEKEKIMFLFYEGNGTLTLSHQNQSALANNRLFLPYAADVKVYPNEACILFYDSVNSYWRFLGKSTTYIPDIISTGEAKINEIKITTQFQPIINNSEINNLNIADQSFLRITTGTSISGFIASNDDNGKLLFLHNVTGNEIQIKNNSSESTLGNRIITGKGYDIYLPNDSVTIFQYDSTSQFWRIAGGTGGSGSSLRDRYVSSNSSVIKFERIVADTSQNSIDLTLPINPIDGDVIGILDASGTFETNPVNLLGNGKKINNESENYSLDINGMYVEIHYWNGSWRFLDVPLLKEQISGLAALVNYGDYSPNTTPSGVNQAIGSVFFQSDGSIWRKLGSDFNDWSKVGEREFVETLSYNSWAIPNQDLEISIPHNYNNIPVINVYDNSTYDFIQTEVKHYSRNLSSILINWDMRDVLFPSGPSSPSFEILIVCK